MAPDFGIGEAIAAAAAGIGDLIGGGAAAAGGIADAAGAAGAGLAAGGADLLGGVGGALGALGTDATSAVTGIGDLFGAGAGGAGAGATDALGAISSAAPIGGAAPAGAGAVDLTSALGFAPSEVGFGAAGDVTSLGTSGGFSIGEVGGFDTSALGTSLGAGGPGTGFAGASAVPTTSAVSGATDLSSLVGGSSATGGGLSAAGGATDAAGSAAGSGSFLDSLGSSAVSSLTKNPLGIAASGIGLGYNILQGQKLTANQQALTGIAQQEAGQGQQLQQYLQNGTLPPGMQAQLDKAKEAAKAQIISGYAAKGLPADPSQNSALAQELAAVDTNSVALQGQIATNLLQAGINETNMSGNLFQALIQMDSTQAKSMGAAIANFSAALAGGPKTISIGATA